MLDIIVAALAVWRASVLLVDEEGPFRIPARLRARLGIVRYPDKTMTVPGTFLAGVFSCIWCLSLWLGALATILLWPNDWRAWVMLPWALSGVSVLIEVNRKR